MNGKGGNGGQGNKESRSDKSSNSSSKSQSPERVYSQSIPVFIPPYPGPHPTYYPHAGAEMAFHQPGDHPLFQMMHEMNNRPKNIESNVAKIQQIEHDLTNLKLQVSSIRDVSKSTKDKIIEIEKSCEHISEVNDQLFASNSHTVSEIMSLKDENTKLSSQINELTKQNTDLKNMCIDIQSKQLSNDLIFFGIEEAQPGTRENTEETLKTFISEKLEQDAEISHSLQIRSENIEFSRVVRLGDPNKIAQNRRPRPIVASFHRFKDRDSVRKAGILLNKKKQPQKIHEYFPKEIEERRKRLYPVMRFYIDQGEKVSLVRDKLYVNNMRYDPDANCLVNDRHAERRNQSRRPGQPDYGKAPQQHGRQEYPLSTARSAARSVDIDKPTALRFHSAVNSTIETPNKFAPLSESDRQTNKRKDASPIEIECQNKRVANPPTPEHFQSYHMEISDNNLDSQTLELDLTGSATKTFSEPQIASSQPDDIINR